jgi:hypothetical protein
MRDTGGSPEGPTVRLPPDPHAGPTERLRGDGGHLVLGRYRLGRRLGAGGFGVVWHAHDEKLEREVAVKVIPRDRDADSERQVEREARAAARLNHPGIVGLYEFGADEHDVYLVSELVHGGTLADLIRGGGLADADVGRIGVALCEALEHAHARGVVHRDVKPQNVMVLAEPAAGAGFAKLADFGVARVEGGDPLTITGDVVGTLAYMAPEQADARRATGASDVYSLALCLYEAWTGVNPVRGGGPAATARNLGRPLPPLGSHRRDLPLELCDVIDDALAPEPEMRPRPAELRAELARALPVLDDEGGLAEPETQRRFGLTTRERRAPRDLALPGGRTALLIYRLLAGLAAGGLVLGALALPSSDPSFSPLAAAAAAALAVAVLPRIGWVATALGACVWLAGPDADAEGTALVIAAALGAVPLLVPRAGLVWSLPALAPLLGTVALAPAFPALAAVAGRSAWQRAGLAAAGYLWLAVAELLGGDELFLGIPDGALPRESWEGSLTGAVSDALGPLVTSPALAPAVVWAAFAAALPVVVRGRWLGIDAVAAAAWCAALIVVHQGLGELLASTTVLDQPRGAVAGVVIGALVAVVAIALAPAPEEADRRNDPRPGAAGVPGA